MNCQATNNRVCASKASVLSAVTSAQLLQHRSPLLFPSVLLVAFLSAHGPFAKKACREEKNILNKQTKNPKTTTATKKPPWLRGEICPLEMKGQGRKTKGERACSGVELDISVSCQRLVHGCGMLMSEVSLGFFPLPLFLYPHLLSLVHPLPSPSVSFSGRVKKKRIDS